MIRSRICFGLLFIIVSSAKVLSQAPDIEWQHIYGNPGITEYIAEAYSTPDGGYAAGGSVRWEGDTFDNLIIKFDANGDSLWSFSYGTDENNEFTNSFIVLPDGNFVCAGYYAELLTPTITGNVEARVLIVDPDGNSITKARYGTDDKEDFANAITMTPDSNLIFCGSTNPDGIIEGQTRIRKIDYNFEIPEFSLLPIFGVYTDGYEIGQQAIVSTHDSAYVAVGYFQSKTTTRFQGTLYKTLDDYPISYKHTFHNSGNVYYNGISLLRDSTYMVCGTISYDISNSNRDLLLVKYNKTARDTLWSKKLGETTTDEYGIWIDKTADGGFVVIGTRQTEKNGVAYPWVIRFDSEGEILWEKTIRGDRRIGPESISVTDDGGYIITGQIVEEDNIYRYDIIIIKLEPDNTSSNNELESKGSKTILYPNYPNPIQDETTIKYFLAKTGFVELTIYDITGNKIQTLVNSIQNPGEHNIVFNGTNLNQGIYLISLKTDNNLHINKMIVLE